jgi:hypothetical protein
MSSEPTVNYPRLWMASLGVSLVGALIAIAADVFGLPDVVAFGALLAFGVGVLAVVILAGLDARRAGATVLGSAWAGVRAAFGWMRALRP